MCYSGQCRWENHMGDCRCSSYDIQRYVCYPTDDVYNATLNDIERRREIKKRDEKILKILKRNKLSCKND